MWSTNHPTSRQIAVVAVVAGTVATDVGGAVAAVVGGAVVAGCGAVVAVVAIVAVWGTAYHRLDWGVGAALLQVAGALLVQSGNQAGTFASATHETGLGVPLGKLTTTNCPKWYVIHLKQA